MRERHPLALAAGIAGAVFVSFGTMGAVAFAPDTDGNIQAVRTVETLQQGATPDLAPQSFIQQETVRSRDTLAALLERLRVSDARALLAQSRSADVAQFVRRLRAGKTLTVWSDADGKLLRLALPASEEARRIVLERDAGGSFALREEDVPLEVRWVRRSGEIRSSLFAATDDADVPDAVASKLADAFGSDVDFHRDLRRGDHFSVLYEVVHDDLGRPLRTGRLLAAELENGGRRLSALYYDNGDGHGAYYDAMGTPLKRAFLRSPLEFSRVTSGFAMRMHPILHTWRAHKGVDYGAPAGTPVRATGDAKVEFAGRQGGYGNVVILRHSSRYETYYAHLSGFAAGVRTGARIEQGAVLGYVGSTGWATGPHLHYEVRVNGEHQDPQQLQRYAAVEPAKPDRKEFERSVAPMRAQLASIRKFALGGIE
ncbi:MAG: M23 family metallopeptidase [Rhodocyclaceae bacterium]|nr:M23 family metallopeptidase [Rhodocyclaceae bacterium]MBX3666767.1 M23 family metallopeptidase [Rhodocyclaceae bacterium]